MLTVLYHKDADGFGAAYAVWKNISLKAQEEAVFIAVQYDEPLPEIDEQTDCLMIVDFSYSREICDDLAERFDLVVIDHHKTAEKVLAGADYAFFDLNKSGAVLTWEYMTKDPVPEVLKYVQDRDLWKFELPESREVNAYIKSLPFEFNEWGGLTVEDALVGGRAILRYQDKQVDNAVKSAVVVKAGDVVYAVASSPVNVSEVGEALLKKYPEIDFASIHFDILSEKKTVVSLRSRDGGYDVSALAKKFGGGGHHCAAGYTFQRGYGVTL